MEEHGATCRKFIKNPHLDPLNGREITEREFNYRYDMCKEFYHNFKLPEGENLANLYSNEYYGRRVAKDFRKTKNVNPITGEDLDPSSPEYKKFVDLDNYYERKDNVSIKSTARKSRPPIPERRSQSSITKRRSELLPIPERRSQSSITKRRSELLPIPERRSELLPIPERRSELLPIPGRRPELLPIPGRRPELLPIPDIEWESQEQYTEKDPLTDLSRLIIEMRLSKSIRNIVDKNLVLILTKNSVYDKKTRRYILTGDVKNYGLKQFVFDLVIEGEFDLVKQILEFFGMEYLDITILLFDFPLYAMNETLIVNYFDNAPLDVDWDELNDILQEVYETWDINDKITLITLLLGSAILVDNKFILRVLKQIVNEWRDGIEEEITDIEDVEERDKLIDLFQTLDILTIY